MESNGTWEDLEFLCYLNDDNRHVSGYFEILEINQGYVKFMTHGSIVLIPMIRVLKIKIKEGKNYGP